MSWCVLSRHQRDEDRESAEDEILSLMVHQCILMRMKFILISWSHEKKHKTNAYIEVAIYVNLHSVLYSIRIPPSNDRYLLNQ
jgi:hypothetical protein